MGKILGLDIGDKRVGLALSDPSQLIATPFGYALRAKGEAESRIIELVLDENVAKIVVGLPLDANGALTPQAQKVQNFCRRLARRVEAEFCYVDEFLSSNQAEEMLRSKKRKHSSEKGMVDAFSASIILQQYLDTAKQRSGVKDE